MIITIIGGYKKDNVITLNTKEVDISFAIMESDTPDIIINDLNTESIFINNISCAKSIIRLLLNKRYFKIE